MTLAMLAATPDGFNVVLRANKPEFA